jgi:fructokinase
MTRTSDQNCSAAMAALILGLLTRGGEGLAPPVLEQIARMASMAAAITVGRPGADLPSLAEMQALVS